MSLKTIAIVAIGLWAVTILIGGYLFVAGITGTSTDGRTEVYLSAQERDFVLNEMRGMLEGLKDITLAMAGEDRDRIISVSTANGMASVGGVNPMLMAKLPAAFMGLGKDTHVKFDAISTAAQNGESLKEIQTKIGILMENCVACHATYRFVAK